MKSSYAYLLAAFLGWFVAQLLKNVLQISVKGRSGGIEKYMSSGGMPSAHTATVVAFTSVVFVHQGVSDLFALSTVLAAITIYDALVARRSIGEQGTALLKLLAKSPEFKNQLPRVALGHTPAQVFIGGVIGLVVGYVVALFITF